MKTDENIEDFLNDDFIDSLIKEELNLSNKIHIPIDFSDKVCKKIENKYRVHDFIIEHILKIVAAIIIPIVCFATLQFTGYITFENTSIIKTILSFISEYKWHITFAIVFIEVIQLSDIYFVKKHLQE